MPLPGAGNTGQDHVELVDGSRRVVLDVVV